MYRTIPMGLSRIILDNEDAKDEVPVDGEGLFINQDDLLIKGYWIDEKTL